jgi:hypothetical protein
MKIGRNEAQALATGLGWFSIALGLAELLAPGKLTRSVGMTGSERIVSTYGTREIVNGIGLLTAKDPLPWVWGRVGGDALDLVTLSSGLTTANPRRDRLGGALLAIAAVTALDVATAQLLRTRQRTPRRMFDYSDRSGFSRGVDAVRGAARDFRIPRDMRAPEPLRPWHA